MTEYFLRLSVRERILLLVAAVGMFIFVFYLVFDRMDKKIVSLQDKVSVLQSDVERLQQLTVGLNQADFSSLTQDKNNYIKLFSQRVNARSSGISDSNVDIEIQEARFSNLLDNVLLLKKQNILVRNIEINQGKQEELVSGKLEVSLGASK